MSKEEKKKILDEFDLIKSEEREVDINQFLATPDDLVDLGSLEIYDYENDLNSSTMKGMEVLDSLVDMYLGDIPNIEKTNYIKNKKIDDAKIYAETLFLQKMTKKLLITQMQLMDNGETSARHQEVINQTIREVRENSKFASSVKSNLENYYKELRKDIVEVIKDKDTLPSDEKETSTKTSTSGVDLNDIIKKAMAEKEKEKRK